MAVEISSEFSLVAVIAVATFLANLYMMSGVVKARKKYGIQYPTLYALESDNKEAKLFNCVQRGHQNFLEIVPFFLTLLVLAGLQHPRIAAITGCVFLGGRVAYFNGYATGEPKKRMRGATLGYACIVVLSGCCISFAVQQLFSS